MNDDKRLDEDESMDEEVESMPEEALLLLLLLLLGLTVLGEESAELVSEVGIVEDDNKLEENAELDVVELTADDDGMGLDEVDVGMLEDKNDVVSCVELG